MKARKDDADIARLERRLRDANDELAAARQRGEESAPLVRLLEGHLKDNRFAERLVMSLRESRRERHA